MFELVIRPGAAPLPNTIDSAAYAHLQLPKLTEFVDRDTFPCHVDDQPKPFPGGVRNLVSSHAGPLRTLLLTIPNYVVQENALAAVFRELPKALPHDTHFVILTHAGARRVVEEWFRREAHAACECRITAVADEVVFSMWAEDPYAVGVDATHGPALIEPQLFDRKGDLLIASFVAAGAGFHRIASPLVFEGGNVLVGDDFYLVGADYLFQSWQQVHKTGMLDEKYGQARQKIEHEIRRDFLDPTRKAHFLACKHKLGSFTTQTTKLPNGPNGAYVDVVEHIYNGSRDSTYQPLYHLDMFVTLVGRADESLPFRILVGSPRLAADALGAALPRHARADAFDEIAEALAQHEDFEVRRNPLPYVYLDYRDEADGSYHRWWYYASANNALVEQREDAGRRVWLPSYGYAPLAELSVTDAMNRELWEDVLDFEVTMMPNCQALAQNLGSIHCIKKYLAR